MYLQSFNNSIQTAMVVNETDEEEEVLSRKVSHLEQSEVITDGTAAREEDD